MLRFCSAEIHDRAGFQIVGSILIRILTVSLQVLQATVVIKLITTHMKAEGEARGSAGPPIHSVGVHFACMLSSG